jgi:hypothetical protein
MEGRVVCFVELEVEWGWMRKQGGGVMRVRVVEIDVGIRWIVGMM